MSAKALGLNACIVYSATGLNGKVAKAPMGVWFGKDFSDQVPAQALERLKTAAEKRIDLKDYEAFRSDQGLRIRVQVMASGRTAFLRAARELSSLLQHHLHTRAPHQQLLTPGMVEQLLA